MKYLDIVFDGPTGGNEFGRFVEVEDDKGKSINFGEWIKRTDGHWALRIKRDSLGVTEGVLRIAEERGRQVIDEGWTSEHDDAHTPGVLAIAGATYALNSTSMALQGNPPNLWPWAKSWWKPKTALRDLEKAGALIAAEIDRRLRNGEK